MHEVALPPVQWNGLGQHVSKGVGGMRGAHTIWVGGQLEKQSRVYLYILYIYTHIYSLTSLKDFFLIIDFRDKVGGREREKRNINNDRLPLVRAPTRD